MKKVLIGFLAFIVVMSFSVAYAAPLVYTNVRPVTIGSTSDPAGSCLGYANCELQTLLFPIDVVAGQEVAGYWALGGFNPNISPAVSFEITANSTTMQMGIFSDINGDPDTDGRTLVDIFLGPAAARTTATLTFSGGLMKITNSSFSVDPLAVHEGTFAGISTSGFGFYIQPNGENSDVPTYYSLDQLNGGLAQMVAFHKSPDNRWTIAFEDTPIRNANGDPNGDYDYNDFIFQIESIVPVPEPGTLILLGAGLVGLAAVRRKK